MLRSSFGRFVKWRQSTISFVMSVLIPSVCPHRTGTGLDSPLGLQKIEAPRISRHSAHEGGKVIRPTLRLPLPPRRYCWYSSFRG